MNFLKLLFEARPRTNFDVNAKIWYGLLVLGLLLFLGYFVLKAIRRKTKNKTLKKIVREFPTGLLWFGLIAMFLVWMRYESVPWLSMRFLWVLWAGGILVWLFFKIRKSIKVVKRIARAKKSPNK
jgi:Na+/H+ antiporter NhaD/arsenite permease-like protein